MDSEVGTSACSAIPIEMKQRRLGNSDVLLPLVAQGTTGTGPSMLADVERDRNRVEVLRAGIECGMTFIDTAELYGGGHGEEIAGKAIAGMRDRVFLASKFSPSNSTAAGVVRALEGSLRRLGTEYLDLYQLHWPNPDVPLEETLGALVRLVEERKIRHIGLSNISLPELRLACNVAAIASVQVEYNLTERLVEAELLPFCQEQGITVLAYSPLDRGRSLGDCAELRRLSEKYGRSPAQIVLNWVTRSPAVIAVTMTTKLAHIKESADVGSFSLSPADAQTLGDATRRPVEWVEPVEVEIVRGSRPVHLTLDDARRNIDDLIPHPVQLAESIRRFGIEKPIRVVRNEGSKPSKRFRLVDEHLRFWAWVIAYGWERLIPAYVLA